MNITFPDNANISIIVNTSGFDGPTIGTLDGGPRILLSPAAPPPQRSSRRPGMIFLGAAGLMCVAVLSIVHFQRPSGMPQIDPAHAERLSSNGGVQYPSDTYAAPIARTTPSQQARADAEAEATVRRLLQQAPTITPPPGAPVAPVARPQPPAAPVAALRPSAAPAPAANAAPVAGKPNAFGMSD